MPQMLDMNLQDLVFALWISGLVFVCSFLAIFLFLPFGMGMFALCHCILEVYSFFFDFLQGLTAKSLPKVSEQALNLDS
jgi:hypothetical protein